MSDERGIGAYSLVNALLDEVEMVNLKVSATSSWFV